MELYQAYFWSQCCKIIYQLPRNKQTKRDKTPVSRKLSDINERNIWQQKQRDIPCFWIGRINIIIMTVLPKTIYNAMQSLSNYQGIFHRTRTKDFTTCVGTQKTLNSQSNLEKEEWNWRNQPDWLQALVQSHSHQDSAVRAQRQKYRSMEQNRKPRDKSTHIWTPYLWQRKQEYTME